MNNPKKIAERRFGEAAQLAAVLRDVVDMLGKNIAYVRLPGENDGTPASIIRVWEDTLTDGSKVYEVHIL